MNDKIDIEDAIRDAIANTQKEAMPIPSSAAPPAVLEDAVAHGVGVYTIECTTGEAVHVPLEMLHTKVEDLERRDPIGVEFEDAISEPVSQALIAAGHVHEGLEDALDIVELDMHHAQRFATAAEHNLLAWIYAETRALIDNIATEIRKARMEASNA